jgi:type VI secretion system secreted protein VgrG
VDPIKDLNELADMENPAVIMARANRATEMQKVKTACIRGVDTYLNNKLKLKIEDPICGPRTLPITFKIVWVESDEHYVFRVYGNAQREQVKGDQVYIGLATDDLTHAHEFAHCLGAPDEYSYHDTEDEQVRYYKPDGSLGSVIIGKPADTNSEKPYSSIMNDATNVEVRHGWYIAIEAASLLSEKIGRKIKCDILLA